jgi:hypothetical protein
MKNINKKLPKQIEMFSKTFRITYHRKIQNVDPQNKTVKIVKGEIVSPVIYGNVNFTTNTIRLYKGKGYPIIEIWHNLLHEVVHIIEKHKTIKFRKQRVEDIVDCLAGGFLHFLVENNIKIIKE